MNYKIVSRIHTMLNVIFDHTYHASITNENHNWMIQKLLQLYQKEDIHIPD